MKLLEKLFEMTALSHIAAEPGTLIMIAIGLGLLDLGISKQY